MHVGELHHPPLPARHLPGEPAIADVRGQIDKTLALDFVAGRNAARNRGDVTLAAVTGSLHGVRPFHVDGIGL